MTKVYFLISIAAISILSNRALAESKTVAAGETLNLTADLVLTGDDSLQLNGTKDKHCIVTSTGPRIRSDDQWKGAAKISYCDFKGLGGEKDEAIKLRAGGTNSVDIDHCQFDACGQVHLITADSGTFNFRDNTILETSLVPVTHLREQCRPSFEAECRGKGQKVFAGNRVYKAYCDFNGDNVLIGGDKDEDSNFLIGMRCGLLLSGGQIRVAHNYIHTLYENGWSQVANVEAGQQEHALIEDNVLHQGEWVVRSLVGELRNNVILDMNGHDWIIGPKANAKIHHNIFARYVTWDKNKNAGISFVYAGEGMEVYNNTFDGGGKAKSFDVPVVDTNDHSAVASLRSNVFYNFYIRYPVINVNTYGEKASTTDKPARLGYADYNCFSVTYNPETRSPKENYAISVSGKTERRDAGFGLNDLPKGGDINAQVDPKFAGPIPNEFPWKDDEIKAGKVKVSEMLALYRKAYTPAPSSPLIGAGDPADGKGNDIGAVTVPK